MHIFVFHHTKIETKTVKEILCKQTELFGVFRVLNKLQHYLGYKSRDRFHNISTGEVVIQVMNKQHGRFP